MRRKTKIITVGAVKVGGNNPISVQSMTNTLTYDVAATVSQIHQLTSAGCEIVRVSVPDEKSAASLKTIMQQITLPLIADIHFDHTLALQSIKAGVDGLRINPGNIGSADRVKQIVEAACKKKISIRIGVNSGSLEKQIKKRHNGVTPEAMVESGLKHISLLEKQGFYDIKISLKMSDVRETIDCYRLMAKEVDYPFHVGITEAGTVFSGTIKSSVGLGILLNEGLGDTLRVSLSGDPVREVPVGFEILKSLGLRQKGINIISCPTCARQGMDVASIAEELEQRFATLDHHFDLAVMGCVVNGPGEAARCDVGVAGGKGVGVIFKKGKIIRKIKTDEILEEMIKEVNDLVAQKNKKSKKEKTES